jgi:hypothetical protein
MMKEDRQLDDLFRSKLENFELKPPAYLWDGILEKQAAARRKKRLLVWWISGTAASLLIAFLLGWELQRGQDNRLDENQIVRQEEVTGNDAEVVEVPDSPGSTHRTPGAGKPTTAERKDQPQSAANYLSQFNDNKAVLSRENDGEVALARNLSRNEARLPLLQKMAAALSWDWPGTGELDNQRGTDGRLTGEDRRIIAMNQAEMEKEQKQSSDVSWAVGAMITPVLNVNSTKYSQQYAAEMSSSGSGQDVSLGGGITVEMQTRGRWSIQSGIRYSRIAQNSSGASSGDFFASVAPDNSVVAERNKTGQLVVNGPAGQVVLDGVPRNTLVSADLESSEGLSSVLMTNSDFDQLFDYVEIPLLLRYQLVEGVIGVQLSAGLNSGFLVRNAVYTEGENIGKTADMNDFTFSSDLGVGLSYKLSSKLQLRLEPQFRYFLHSLSNNDNIEYKPYSFGMSTGVSYSF